MLFYDLMEKSSRAAINSTYIYPQPTSFNRRLQRFTTASSLNLSMGELLFALATLSTLSFFFFFFFAWKKAKKIITNKSFQSLFCSDSTWRLARRGNDNRSKKSFHFVPHHSRKKEMQSSSYILRSVFIEVQ